MFYVGSLLLSGLVSATCLSCISIKNRACKVRPEVINFSIKTSKCSASCNIINDPYPKICVSDVVKGLNVKVFNLMPRTNETKLIKWHETCKCKWRLDSSVYNNKQRWNDDKFRCE